MQQVCIHHFYARVNIAYACVGRACYDTYTCGNCYGCNVQSRYNLVRQEELLLTTITIKVFALSNTAAHAPCFIQKKLLLCYLPVPFQLASPPGFHVSHIREPGNIYSVVPSQQSQPLLHREYTCLCLYIHVRNPLLCLNNGPLLSCRVVTTLTVPAWLTTSNQSYYSCRDNCNASPGNVKA